MQLSTRSFYGKSKHGHGRAIFPSGPDLSDDNISDDDDVADPDYVEELMNTTEENFEDSSPLLSPKRMSHRGKILPLLQ